MEENLGKKHRMVRVFLMVVMIILVICACCVETRINQMKNDNVTSIYAWWGTLYPKFCFCKRKKGKLKVSFWLAKAFKWC